MILGAASFSISATRSILFSVKAACTSQLSSFTSPQTIEQHIPDPLAAFIGEQRLKVSLVARQAQLGSPRANARVVDRMASNGFTFSLGIYDI